jgi:ribosome-binding factor A
MSNRIEKVNELILHELAPVIELYTKELGGLVTITYVNTSQDLANATIGISCYKTAEKEEDVIKTLNQYTHMFHSQISKRIKMRRTPILYFKLDNTGEYAERIDTLFNQIKQEKDSLK